MPENDPSDEEDFEEESRYSFSTIDNGQNEQEETDFSISDIFGDPRDRDTSSSHHSSNSFTIGSQPDISDSYNDLLKNRLIIPLQDLPQDQRDHITNSPIMLYIPI